MLHVYIAVVVGKYQFRDSHDKLLNRSFACWNFTKCLSLENATVINHTVD